MARQQNLKVFRTPTGFHDVYVAAPSRKAALEAWGSDHDLFARGVAEQVTDEALMREPLAHPGKIIKLSRGTVAEQLAALPDDSPPPAKKPASSSGPGDQATPKGKPTKPKPKPDRDPLDRARQALDEAEARFEADRADLKRRADQLAHERAELEKREKVELDELNQALDKADADYQRRMRAWRG